MDTEHIVSGVCDECEADHEAVKRIRSKRFLDKLGKKADKYIEKERDDMVYGVDKFAEDMAEPFKSKHRMRKAWYGLNHYVSPKSAFKAVLFLGFWMAMGLLFGLLFIKLIDGR